MEIDLNKSVEEILYLLKNNLEYKERIESFISELQDLPRDNNIIDTLLHKVPLRDSSRIELIQLFEYLHTNVVFDIFDPLDIGDPRDIFKAQEEKLLKEISDGIDRGFKFQRKVGIISCLISSILIIIILFMVLVI